MIIKLSQYQSEYYQKKLKDHKIIKKWDVEKFVGYKIPFFNTTTNHWNFLGIPASKNLLFTPIERRVVTHNMPLSAETVYHLTYNIYDHIKRDMCKNR